MVRVRVYFEGDPKLKRGFAAFLAVMKQKATAAGIGWELVAGRSRSQAMKSFQLALDTHRGDIIALLVDAEGQVVHERPWQHLASLPDAALKKPKGARDEHAHLMVQIMESWFLADKKALEAYYGQGFRPSCLPKTSNVEDVPKETVLDCLNQAIASTKKSEYHKTRHAPDLLEKINPDKVRRESKWCDRLFTSIENAIEAAG
jgi:hypothetical protein